MTGTMLKQIISKCSANYPNYGEDLKAKTALWFEEFGKYDDDLMYTAMLACIGYCEKFPTVANIKQAIRDLQYVEQTKPKQIAYEVKRFDDIAKKANEFVQSGKAKEYMQSLDVTKMLAYAKVFFPDISRETVIKNYPEFSEGMRSQEQCFACRNSVQACGGCLVKHVMCSNGYIKNKVARCEKVQHA